MDEIKIENFSREHPDRTFPTWRALSKEETARIRARLAERVGASTMLDKAALTRLVLERGAALRGLDARDGRFSIRAVLSDHAIAARSLILINWYQFDRVDEMHLEDVDACFEDLWYPAAEDVDLFDESLSWILSVWHYGAVTLVRLS